MAKTEKAVKPKAPKKVKTEKTPEQLAAKEARKKNKAERQKARDMAEVFVGRIDAECGDLRNENKQYLCGQMYLKYRELARTEKTE